jgi:hypothetical protein
MELQTMRVSVNKWIQSLCEELDMRIQVTWNDIQGMKTLAEATWQEFKMQLPETKAQAGHGGCMDLSPRMDRMKSPRLNESMSWALIHLQFKDTVEHNWVD